MDNNSKPTEVGIRQVGESEVHPRTGRIISKFNPFAYNSEGNSVAATMVFNLSYASLIYVNGRPSSQRRMVLRVELDPAEPQPLLIIESDRNDDLEIDIEVLRHNVDIDDVTIRRQPDIDHSLTGGTLAAYLTMIAIGGILIGWQTAAISTVFAVYAVDGMRRNVCDNQVWVAWFGTTLFASVLAMLYQGPILPEVLSNPWPGELEPAHNRAFGIAKEAPDAFAQLQGWYRWVLGLDSWVFVQTAVWDWLTAGVMLIPTLWDDLQHAWRKALRKARGAADKRVKARDGFVGSIVGLIAAWLQPGTNAAPAAQPTQPDATTQPATSTATAPAINANALSSSIFLTTLITSLLAEVPHLIHTMFTRR